jgi:hypothetical protein
MIILIFNIIVAIAIINLVGTFFFGVMGVLMDEFSRSNSSTNRLSSKP